MGIYGERNVKDTELTYKLFKMYLFILFYLYLERGEGRKRGRETSMCGCLSRAPYWGLGPQPGPVL